MNDSHIHALIEVLKEELRRWEPAAVARISRRGDPFKVLVSTIISSRTKDQVTIGAYTRLFALAQTPGDLARLDLHTISRAIYPAGFYHTKARNLKKASQIIFEKYGGKVPDSMEELLKLPGVGRKTANLVLNLGFGKAGICVDTHVHRVSNRLGYIKTSSPEQTERALREKLPPEYWIEYNGLLVSFGKNVCTPVSPFCSKCRVSKFCEKVGVTQSR
ncbi:MAG: endonuclease III domain-containing protein [Spirochaetota bacterium]